MLPTNFNLSQMTILTIANRRQFFAVIKILVNLMKLKPLYLAIATAGLMALANSANAATITDPYVSVTISNEDGSGSATHDFSTLTWTPVVNTPDILLTSTTGLGWQSDSAKFKINSASYDKDPQLNFSVTATNNSTVNKTYSFSYNTPFDPILVGEIDSHAELHGTLLDSNLSGSAFVKPVTGTPFILTSFDLDTNGDAIPKNVDVGTAFTVLNVMQTFVKDSTLNCTIACETMSAVLTFTLSKGDSVTFTGNVTQLAAVPVPGAVWLFGSALAGLLGLRRNNSMASV